MHLSRRLTLVGLGIFLCCVLSLVYSLLSTRAHGVSASLNGQMAPLGRGSQRGEPPLRLEAWGECFQSAPHILTAVASLQSDHAGRSSLRQAWLKELLSPGKLQLIFFLRYAETANRRSTIDEFHAHQDILVNSNLPRQDNLAMLQAAAAWFTKQCPRTQWLLFVEHGAAIGAHLQALHAAGTLVLALPYGLANPVNATENLHLSPRCLILSREAAKLVPTWPTTWRELLSVKGFNATVRDVTNLLCSALPNSIIG